MEKNIPLEYVLLSLAPNAKWSITGNADSYEDINWYEPPVEEGGIPKPTEEEIEVEIERLKNYVDPNVYKLQRSQEYPSITELADALYWNSKGDSSHLEAYYAACEAVKDKYPKP